MIFESSIDGIKQRQTPTRRLNNEVGGSTRQPRAEENTASSRPRSVYYNGHNFCIYTINYYIRYNCKIIILLSHLGRVRQLKKYRDFKITLKAIEMKIVSYPTSNRVFRLSSLFRPIILFLGLLLSPTTISQTTDNSTEPSSYPWRGWNIYENVSMSTVSMFQHSLNLPTYFHFKFRININ